MTTPRPVGLSGTILVTWLLANRTELSPDGCLIWQMAKDKDGYGLVHADGKQQRAHRFVKTVLEGSPADPSMLIDHICRVHACVNVSHLRWVTHQQNTIENSLSIQAKNAQKTSCPKCGGTFDPFFLNGKQYRYCKSCSAKHRKEWFQKNKQEQMAKRRIYAEKNRDRFNTYRRVWRANRKAEKRASDT